MSEDRRNNQSESCGNKTPKSKASSAQPNTTKAVGHQAAGQPSTNLDSGDTARSELLTHALAHASPENQVIVGNVGNPVVPPHLRTPTKPSVEERVHALSIASQPTPEEDPLAMCNVSPHGGEELDLSFESANQTVNDEDLLDSDDQEPAQEPAKNGAAAPSKVPADGMSATAATSVSLTGTIPKRPLKKPAAETANNTHQVTQGKPAPPPLINAAAVEAQARARATAAVIGKARDTWKAAQRAADRATKYAKKKPSHAATCAGMEAQSAEMKAKLAYEKLLEAADDDVTKGKKNEDTRDSFVPPAPPRGRQPHRKESDDEDKKRKRKERSSSSNKDHNSADRNKKSNRNSTNHREASSSTTREAKAPKGQQQAVSKETLAAAIAIVAASNADQGLVDAAKAAAATSKEDKRSTDPLGLYKKSKSERNEFATKVADSAWPESKSGKTDYFAEFVKATGCKGNRIQNAHVIMRKPAFPAAWESYNDSGSRRRLRADLIKIAISHRENPKPVKEKPKTKATTVPSGQASTSQLTPPSTIEQGSYKKSKDQGQKQKQSKDKQRSDYYLAVHRGQDDRDSLSSETEWMHVRMLIQAAWIRDSMGGSKNLPHANYGWTGTHGYLIPADQTGRDYFQQLINGINLDDGTKFRAWTCDEISEQEKFVFVELRSQNNEAYLIEASIEAAGWDAVWTATKNGSVLANLSEDACQLRDRGVRSYKNYYYIKFKVNEEAWDMLAQTSTVSVLGQGFRLYYTKRPVQAGTTYPTVADRKARAQKRKLPAPSTAPGPKEQAQEQHNTSDEDETDDDEDEMESDMTPSAK